MPFLSTTSIFCLTFDLLARCVLRTISLTPCTWCSLPQPALWKWKTKLISFARNFHKTTKNTWCWTYKRSNINKWSTYIQHLYVDNAAPRRRSFAVSEAKHSSVHSAHFKGGNKILELFKELRFCDAIVAVKDKIQKKRASFHLSDNWSELFRIAPADFITTYSSLGLEMAESSSPSESL